MRLARDFRDIARNALRGKWKIAVLVGLVASVLGAVENMGPNVELNVNEGGASANFEFAGQTIFSTAEGVNAEMGAWFIGGFTYILLVSLALVAIYIVLGSTLKVGYAKFNLNLVDHREGTFENLFGYFSFWSTCTVSRVLQYIYVFLWSILLVIPGVIAYFRYAMTSYILAENPDLSASEAIHRSKQMMVGNKWRLFCLQFSFIGWDILAALTLGIGNIWLTPYKQAAVAAFYRDISGNRMY